jgi:hypothetical protein
MRDDALRELLRSPLDDRPRQTARRLPILVALGSAALGAALVAGGAALAGDGTPASTSTIPPTTAPPADPEPATPRLAPGVRAEVVRVLRQDDRWFVTLTALVEPGEDPEAAEAPPSANWGLRFEDGSEVGFLEERVDAFLPGAFTIIFPAGPTQRTPEAVVADPAERVERGTATWDVGAAALPWDGPLPEDSLQIAGTSIVVDGVTLAGDGGTVSWHVEGRPLDVRASVDLRADFGIGGDPQAIAAEWVFGGAPLQLRGSPTGASAEGTLPLFRLDDPEAPSWRSRWWGDPAPTDVEGLVIDWSVTTYHYGEEAVVIPIAPESIAG